MLIALKYYKETYRRPESEYWVLHQLKKKKEKSEKKSEELRLKGNTHFQRKEYSNCCHYYTKSLCYASRNGVSYGLALANRSAALYYIGDFEVIICLLYSLKFVVPICLCR